MSANNTFVCGIVLLVFTNMAVILAFSSPYWIIESVNYGTGESRHGLWFECGYNRECVTNYRLQYKPEEQSKGNVATLYCMNYMYCKLRSACTCKFF